jgi:hypothetical protein
MSQENLKNFIRRTIIELLDEKNLEETSFSSGAGAYNTPFAFRGKGKSSKKKEKKVATNSTGYKIVESGAPDWWARMSAKQQDDYIKTHPNSRQAKDDRDIDDKIKKFKADQKKKRAALAKKKNVTEGKYHDYRNDDSVTPKQKIGRSMREIRDHLTEIDKLTKMNVRLKTEMGVDSRSYWKNTHKAMRRISERLIKLAKRVGQLY